jgi:hypothetical protein
MNLLFQNATPSLELFISNMCSMSTLKSLELIHRKASQRVRIFLVNKETYGDGGVPDRYRMDKSVLALIRESEKIYISHRRFRQEGLGQKKKISCGEFAEKSHAAQQTEQGQILLRIRLLEQKM